MFYSNAIPHVRERVVNLSGGSSESVHPIFDAQTLYYILNFTHFLSAVLMATGFIMKKIKVLPIIRDWISSSSTNIYLIVLTYAIYYLSISTNTDDKYYVYVRMEVHYFFCWIGSSILFLLFIYLSKFKCYHK